MSSPGRARRPSGECSRRCRARLGTAAQAWERNGRPYANQLRAQWQQLSNQEASLARAQQAREAFLTERPEVSARLAEVAREIGHQEELERTRSGQRVIDLEHTRHLGRSPEIGTGLGIDF